MVSRVRTPFVIRPARPEHKEAVLGFCTHTYTWGDQVPLVWDELLVDDWGQQPMVTVDDRPVGVAKVSLLTPMEAWPHGLRVHPAYDHRVWPDDS